MIVQRSCYCRTLAKILKGVEEKRGVCGKCGGLTFTPHQHIPSNQFPELSVTIPFFLEKAMARIEPLLTHGCQIREDHPEKGVMKLEERTIREGCKKNDFY